MLPDVQPKLTWTQCWEPPSEEERKEGLRFCKECIHRAIERVRQEVVPIYEKWPGENSKFFLARIRHDTELAELMMAEENSFGMIGGFQALVAYLENSPHG